jgi:hypothetical protein
LAKPEIAVAAVKKADILFCNSYRLYQDAMRYMQPG